MLVRKWVSLKTYEETPLGNMIQPGQIVQFINKRYER